MDHSSRISRAIALLEESEIDALLVTDLTNVRYLTGFSGTNGQVLVSGAGALFFTDPRYEARAADLVSGADIVIYPFRIGDVLVEHLIRDQIRRLGIEASSVTLATRDDLAERLPDVGLVPTRNVIERLRRTKDPDEVAAIRRAVEVSDDAFLWMMDRLVPGVTEREVGLDLEVRMRLSGGDEVSFPPIVGSGPLSAHIHHTPSDRPFEKGDLILLDLGARVDGYCSDLTRTVSLGAASEESLDIYQTVLQAQAAAIAEIGPQAETAYVDRVARRIIADAGHEERFGHGLGHGVGLDIHEAPTLKKVSDEKLLVGDVVTVEPGIYLPGRGGIRIEDCVLVTEDGREVLGTAPKEELIQL